MLHGIKLNDLRLQQALAGSALQKRVMEKKLVAELPYLPPERLVTGSFVDEHLADIYSLGVAVFTRLNGGKPPFVGETPDEKPSLVLPSPVSCSALPARMPRWV